MKHFVKHITVAAGLTLLMSGTAIADPKPKGAKNANPQAVASHYAGMTHIWKVCKGGVYYGPKGVAHAYCDKDDKDPAIGLGTWSVSSKGTICQALTWYWKEGKSYGSKVNEPTKKNCIKHVVDPEGVMWRNHYGESDWWRTEGQETLVKGDKVKAKVNRMRRKLRIK